jgi:hypothetical protein
MDIPFYPIYLSNYFVPLVYTTLFDEANYGYQEVLKFLFHATTSSTNYLEFAINIESRKYQNKHSLAAILMIEYFFILKTLSRHSHCFDS